ncbi:hypothetical protein A7P25_00870 [Achromobacter xylosoxidans]|nr:hypothetical protein A7P25_00870 [Achromobacter xylosoxidans]
MTNQSHIVYRFFVYLQMKRFFNYINNRLNKLRVLIHFQQVFFSQRTVDMKRNKTNLSYWKLHAYFATNNLYHFRCDRIFLWI